MSQEKLAILEMLREGKITTEEAMALLKQVEGDGEPARGSASESFCGEERETGIPHIQFGMDFSWINDLKNAVEETARNLIPDGWPLGLRQETFTASTFIGDGACSLVFEGKNAPVKLEAHSGDHVEVEAYYKRKSQWDPHLSLAVENGIISLRCDDNALSSLGISVRVPETAQIGTILLKSKNAPITVHRVEAKKIELFTKNNVIKASHVKGESLYCETKNSAISLADVIMQKVNAQTSNSKISLDNVEAVHANLETSNSKIDVEDSDIVELIASTSNSPLRFERLGYRKDRRDRSIEATTSNGQISIRIPNQDMKCKVRASTTVTGVFTEIGDLEYEVNEKNYVEAQARGYEEAESKLRLNLQTTNLGVYIK